MASVVSVNISVNRGTFKESIETGELRIDHGIVGDAHAANWHRQISLLAQESVEKMTAIGAKGLRPGIFAENITTEGLELYTLPVGTKLRIGECLTEVTQIGKECHQHCQIFREVGMCVMPTEGIFVKVLQEGTVKPGDPITIVEA